MGRRGHSAGQHGRRRIGGVTRAVVIGAITLTAFATAACGKESDSTTTPVGSEARASVNVTEAGTVIATATDAVRGLVFEVQSSSAFGDSALYVRRTDDTPDLTRELLQHRPLVGSCEIPGENVGEFAGYWNSDAQQYGTALVLDPTPRPAAYLVTSCALWVGEAGQETDTATFPDEPFSRVRMR